MNWNHALSIAGVVVPLLGLPTFYATVRWGRHTVVNTFRHAVIEVVDDRVPSLVATQVAPLVDQIGELAEWREHITHELTPNSGSSMKDRLDAVYDVVVDLKEASTVQRSMDEARADFMAEGHTSPREGQFS